MFCGHRLLASCQMWPNLREPWRQLSDPVDRLDGTRRRWSGSFVAGNWTALCASYASWLINHVAPLLQRHTVDLLRRRPGFSRSHRSRVSATAKYFYQSSSCAVISSSRCLPTRRLMTYTGIFMTQLHFYYAALFHYILSIFFLFSHLSYSSVWLEIEKLL